MGACALGEHLLGDKSRPGGQRSTRCCTTHPGYHAERPARPTRPASQARRTAAISNQFQWWLGTQRISLRARLRPERPARSHQRATLWAARLAQTCPLAKNSTPRSRLEDTDHRSENRPGANRHSSVCATCGRSTGDASPSSVKPLQPCLENRLKPQLGLGAGIETERTRSALVKILQTTPSR